MFRIVATLLMTSSMLCLPGVTPLSQDPPPARTRQEPLSRPQDAPTRRGQDGAPGGVSGRQQDPPGRPDESPLRRGATEDRPLLRDLTREQRESIIAVLSDLRPLTNEERRRLSNMDIERFRTLIAQHGPQIIELARLRQSQPEMYRFRIEDFRLLRQSEEIAARLREARKSGRTQAAATMEGELREIVARQIDLRHQARVREVEVLEQRLAEMKRHLAAEREGRDRLVARRLAELVEGAPPSGRDQRRPEPPPGERRGGGESPRP